MVEIAPFKGIMFNLNELKDHGDRLIAPPYDIITEDEQLKYLNLHPHNILHLDWNLNEAGDQDKFSWHQRSGRLLQQWLKEGILTQIEGPAFFYVKTVCHNPITDQSIVRHGFICRMKLVDYEKKSAVKYHEKTFSSHKEERLSLMKATHANLSQVFGFFPDEKRQVFNLINEVTGSAKPEVDLIDYRGFNLKLWVDQDEGRAVRLINFLKNSNIYIADGHHRYETALNYRNYLRAESRYTPGADYVMIYLCSMSDPGLVILPTHRLLNGFNLHSDDILNCLSFYFKINAKPFTRENEPAIKNQFLTKLKKQKNSLGLYLAGRQTYYILKPLKVVWENLAALGVPPELAALDTVILSEIIFKKSLGLTEDKLNNLEVIDYVSNLNQALEKINSQSHKAAFILNPSTIEDILRITEKGLLMPHKSTFFYPKVTTGLVINLLN